MKGLVGSKVGIMLAEETILDKKGRVVIPKHVRERLKLVEGVKLKLVVEKSKVVLTKSLSPEEFIKEMEGCVTEGAPVPKIDPLRLKEIWEKR